MNDIIEKIRAEVERRMRICERVRGEGGENQDYYHGKAVSYNEILTFFSDLEKEEKPTNQDLEKELARFYLKDLCGSEKDEIPEATLHHNFPIMWDDLRDIARHFAQWGAEHYFKSDFLTKFAETTGPIDTMPKNTLPQSKECEKGLRGPLVSNGLEEEIKRVWKTFFFEEGGIIYDELEILARHFTQWQKEQMMKDGLDAVKSGQFNKIEKTIAGVFVKYGMDRQRETMLREAVEVDTSMAEYNDADFKSYLWNILMMKGAINGQKVKLIIVKED